MKFDWLIGIFAALESVRNGILDKNQHERLQIDEHNKGNEKIKPYWYIDPSIVYRAMTSPVNINRFFSFTFCNLNFNFDMCAQRSLSISLRLIHPITRHHLYSPVCCLSFAYSFSCIASWPTNYAVDAVARANVSRSRRWVNPFNLITIWIAYQFQIRFIL